VLGNGVGSNARVIGDNLRFRDNFAQLAAMCRIRGYSCCSRDIFTHDAWQSIADRLAAGHPVIAVLDSFYLPYFWMSYQRAHTLHAVVFWSVDDKRKNVHLSDPFELTCYEGMLPMQELERAWTNGDIGQMYIDFQPLQPVAAPQRALLLNELQSHLIRLLTDSEQLSCLALATIVRDRLESLLTLMGRMSEPDGRLGEDENRRQCSHFLRGIWNFHHTLRWFCAFADDVLRLESDESSATALAGLSDVAQTWLVLRNVFMKYGLSSADRRKTLERSCRERLHRLIDDVTAFSPRLVNAIERDESH
jgi:hypothetical protein